MPLYITLSFSLHFFTPKSSSSHPNPPDRRPPLFPAVSTISACVWIIPRSRPRRLRSLFLMFFFGFFGGVFEVLLLFVLVVAGLRWWGFGRLIGVWSMAALRSGGPSRLRQLLAAEASAGCLLKLDSGAVSISLLVMIILLFVFPFCSCWNWSMVV